MSKNTIFPLATVFQLTMFVASRGTMTPQFLNPHLSDFSLLDSTPKDTFGQPPKEIGKRRKKAYEAIQNKRQFSTTKLKK